MEGHLKTQQASSSGQTSPTPSTTSSASPAPTTTVSSSSTTTTTATTPSSTSFFSPSKSKLHAQEKRSKFQRSGGSKHANSWCSNPNESSSPSTSRATTSGGGGNTAKGPILSSKSTSSNKSISVNSVVVSSLLCEAGSGLVSEDDKPILAGVPVRSGHLTALVHVCVRTFDYKGEKLKELENFPGVLFLMHQWFCPSSWELASLFIYHYNERAETLAPCQDLSCHCRQPGGGGGASAPIIQPSSSAAVSSSFHNDPITSTTTTSTCNGNNGRGDSFAKESSTKTSTNPPPPPSSSSSSSSNTTTTATTSATATSASSSSDNTTTGTILSSATSSFCSGAKAKIRMMKRSSNSSSNNSSSTSSSSLSHLSQDELQHQQQQQPTPVIRCRTQRYKASVCQALRYWIKTFPIHFDADDRLKDVIKEFASQVVEEGHEDWARWLDLSEVPSYDWLRDNNNSYIKVTKPEEDLLDDDDSKPNRKVSLVFDHLEPHELAQHITCLEHRVIRRITFQDFKAYAENGTLADNPMLEQSVSLFNGLSQWIQIVVLSRAAPNQRADVIAKFVRVAKNLLQLQNFNSLMGVVGSLGHSALARLSKTMDVLPTEERKQFVELAKLVASSNNFRHYRRALNESKGFKIPILGVHLKDLISLHTALPDTTENGLINFRKMTQLYLIFKELHELQESEPLGEANDDILNTLKLSLEFQYSEDELYELSLLREPRASNSISPTRGPDHLSYENQVQAIVEAVFRKYDVNNDGLISKDEFQSLSNNYPAIDAFFVLDENRDGMISRAELERYLLNRRNAGSSHNFHEQTYFKPTFCIHCSGLLWGIIKQGYKCRQCGVNAHKYCKDYMLYECKTGQLFNFPSPGSSTHSEPQVKRRGFRLRKKSSSQSESGSPPSPKYFASLEQLSLSTESTEMPASTSTSGIHHAYGSSASLGTGGSSNTAIGGSSGAVHKISQMVLSKEQQLQQKTSLFQKQQPESTTSSRGTKGGLHFHLHGTPKGTRRFSILGSTPNVARTCSSVPSSPKLGGLSAISIPLFSPCRSLFGHSSSSNNQHHHSPTPVPATCQQQHLQQKNVGGSSTTFSCTSSPAKGQAGGGGGGKSLSTIFGSSSNSSTPSTSPNRKPRSPGLTKK